MIIDVAFLDGYDYNFNPYSHHNNMRHFEDDHGGRYTESEDYNLKPRKAWNSAEKKFIDHGSREYEEDTRGAEIVGRRFHPAGLTAS